MSTSPDRSPLLIAALLAALTLAVFAPVAEYPLVDFDDLAYVTANPHVTTGLTPANVRWALTHAHEGYWAPLTWISYMVDAERAGAEGGAYHVTNLALHLANVWLLFAILARATRRAWPSAVVAALFAVHPLHVESVAWVAERKDVLSGFFFFLSIWLYLRYVAHPSWRRFLPVAAGFACGLMSKPIVVTLPFVLLLLDVWPLGRADGGKGQGSGVRWALVREKAPLFILAAVAGVVAIVVQSGAGAVASLATIPLATRAANAVVSLGLYLWQMIWPSRLAAIYPYPGAPPLAGAAIAAVVLIAISIAILRVRRRAPYLLVGWLWYLVTVLPVLGIVQAGPQGRADRYTYLPLVGVALAVVWGLADFGRRSAAARRAVAVAACLTIAVHAPLARRQVGYWRNSEAVFRRAIAVTSGNYAAYTYLGSVLRSEGRMDEALRAFEEAVRLGPRFPEAQAGYGEVLLTVNPYRAAAALAEAVRLKPRDVGAHVNLGTALARIAKLDEAARAFEQALTLDPASADAHYGLALVLARRNRFSDALPHFSEAARLNPGKSDVHIQLGNTFAVQGRMEEAIVELSRAVELKPDDADVRSNLGIALAARGRFDEAIGQLTQAVRLEPEREDLKSNLAYIESRRQASGKRQ